MATIRRTISLPPAVAARLEREAERRGMSVSAVVVEALEGEATVPYAGMIEDDPELSQKVDEVLARRLT